MSGYNGYSTTKGFCYWLAHVRISRIIGVFLLVVVIIPLVTHHYLSKVLTDEVESDARVISRFKLDSFDSNPGQGSYSVPDLSGNDVSGGSGQHGYELRLRIDELLRIKASVGNELRDLESKRQKLQSEIGLYSERIEELKVDVLRQQQELERLKLSVEQARYALREASEKSTPQLSLPLRLFPTEAEHDSAANRGNPNHCSMHKCFDYSRCSLTSGFPVYFYSPEDTMVPGHILNTFVKRSVVESLTNNPHITYDPSIACVYVVLIGQLTALPPTEQINKFLRTLPYWKGHGRNHILLNFSRNLSAVLDNVDLFRGVDTASALVAQTDHNEFSFRPGFDLIIPPLLGTTKGPVWQDLPALSPARRTYLLAFTGELRLQQTSNTAVFDALKRMQNSNTGDSFRFSFGCENSRISVSNTSDLFLCDSRLDREVVLRESTFNLILAPSNQSVLSTVGENVWFYESLKYGAVPVVLGENLKLPFGDFVNWDRAAVVLPVNRVTELHFVLRSVTDADIVEMRRRGRLFWERYLATTQDVVDTTLSVIRTRLKIAPLQVREEPSPSIFNSTFVPLKSDNILSEIDPEESVGPVESAYASARFYRNFTSVVGDRHFVWNDLVDPFVLYPQLPFEPLLPSEAKFLGSGMGFRPIGQGEGGSGKEFTESLGGNVPREQFTVVMLTYERELVLLNSLQRLYGLAHLNKVVVVWNSHKPPSEHLRWPDIGVPIHVIRAKKNSLNNRFLPYDAIETEAVLSVDDDAHLRHDEITFAFRVWREARDRVVGFPGRYHAWDGRFKSWNYNSNYTCELSMVLTGAAFFHKYYAYLYSYAMPQAIRDKVDAYMNCEDIAMNFLVSHITRKPPLKVTSRWTFRCPGCPVSLSEDDTHFQERHHCINFFAKVFGYVPLLHTQFRADSVLFKTRLPHDKQKCFKFI